MQRNRVVLAAVAVMGIIACAGRAPYTLGMTRGREGPYKGKTVQCALKFECEKEGCYAWTFYARSLAAAAKGSGPYGDHVNIPWSAARYLHNNQDKGGVYIFRNDRLHDTEKSWTLEQLKAQRDADRGLPLAPRSNEWTTADVFASKDAAHDYGALIIPKANVKKAEGKTAPPGHRRIVADNTADPSTREWNVAVFDVADHELAFKAYTEDSWEEEQVILGVFIKKN